MEPPGLGDQCKLDIAWIEDFLELAERGNFTRAAMARNISQAAFSRRIRALEEWLGARLVDRSTHPVRLTAEGERFAHEAGEILAHLEETRARLSHPDLGRNARVRIAMPRAPIFPIARPGICSGAKSPCRSCSMGGAPILPGLSSGK